MTKKELLKALENTDEDAVIICMDGKGGWDNIEKIKSFGGYTAIIFGGGSPFGDE